MDDRNLEALSKSPPDVRTHAVSPGHLDAMSGFEWVWRGIEEIAAEFADVLEVCGFRSMDFGPVWKTSVDYSNMMG